MKRLIPLAALIVAVITSAIGANSAKASPAEQAITQIENDWAVALQKNDQATIDRITAPDWMLTDPTGALITKAAADADMKAGNMKIESFKIDELKVKVFGDTAIVYGLETEKSTYKGNDSSGQYRFTDVFVKQGGAWKAVATHVSKVVKS